MKQSFVDEINTGLKPCECGGEAEMIFAYNDVWEEGAIICHKCGKRLEFKAGNQDAWEKKKIWNKEV